MGFLDIENKGRGYIGPLGDSWKLTYNTSPAILGTGRARLGSLTFPARCDETSKFTIDNYLSVRHYFDDQTTRWLGTFDVNIRSITTDDSVGSFSGISRLSQLDVVRQSSANPTGTYQRKMVPPSGKTYTANAVQYTTPANATVYDVAVESSYVYVLASGAHGGEVVHVFAVDGTWNKVWPVYSDATDVASPQSRYIAWASGYLWVAQVAADRVKRFISFDGTFMNQFGSAGSSDGLFQTISAISASNAAVYVGDSVLGRVQRFSYPGTYLSKFGTPGSTGAFQEFGSLSSVNVDRFDSLLYVGDMLGRVLEFLPNGGYVSNGFGGYNFGASAAYPPFAAGSRIDISFDNAGNAFAVQNGRLFKFTHDQTAALNGAWSDGPRLVETYDLPVDSQVACGSPGIVHAVSQDATAVYQYSGSLNDIYAHVLYYVALAAADFPVRNFTMYDPSIDGNPVTIPEWNMSVWEALTDLCAVTGNAISAFDDTIFFFNRTTTGTYQLPVDCEIEPIEISTRDTGQRVQIVNQNARKTTSGPEVMYSATQDNNRTFNANVGTIDHVTVFQDTYPAYLAQPQPQGSGTNPFINPSVEDAIAPETIESYTNGGFGALTRGTTPGFTLWGSAYARLQFTTIPTGFESYISQRINVYPDVQYDFQAWTTCDGATQQVYLVVDWRNAQGQNLSVDTGSPMPVSAGTWQLLKLSTPVLSPPGAAYAYVQVRHHSSGRAWLVNQSLYADAWSDGWFYKEVVNNPVVAPGRYLVYDSNNILVTPSLWTYYGGSVTASRGTGPGEIVITIMGPGMEIPGFEAPYSIRSMNGTGGLSIMGGGVITEPETLDVGTGVTASVTNKDIVETIDSPFAYAPAIAYTEAAWAAYRASVSQVLKVTIKNNYAPTWVAAPGTSGSHMLTGCLVRYKDAIYIVEDAEADADAYTLTLVLHTSWGGIGSDLDPHPGEIWSGKMAGEFDANWIDYRAQDFTIAPMRNPFDV